MKISFLNHASILIELGAVKLLTDPWFSGYCFNGGWGLRYQNDKAWEKAASATHLWISHYHGDHFHPPTLKKLLELNPGITVMRNRSFNFQMDDTLRNLGFQNIISFSERTTISLGNDIEITRYPTTGIDNMLLVRSPYGLLLNFNDCSLPVSARKRFSRRIGKVDVFLSNFNHAGKLLLYPYPTDEEIRKKLIDAYKENLQIFSASYFLPFASYHYYRAPESVHQNSSLLEGKDLAGLSGKLIPIRISEELEFTPGETAYRIVHSEPVMQNEFTHLERLQTAEWQTILDAGNAYCRRLRKHFLFTSFFLPSLQIRIADLDRQVELHPRKVLHVADGKSEPHIVAHSETLKSWFTDPFGTDSFVVGAHFSINNRNRIPLKWQIVLGLLIDNKLDLASVLKMLFHPRGIRFLWNRREEIWGVVFSGRIHAEYQD